MKDHIIPSMRTSTNPVAFLFLCLPYGISGGFIGVTLPYLLVHQGFSVAGAAAITALGLSANIWRFLWAPFTDLTLSLHQWYLIGTGLCAVTLLLFCFIPLNTDSNGILSITVFVTQVAATIVVSPVGGMMAKTVPKESKGRAGGWYQAGNLGGAGLGGGAGVWISTHASFQGAVIFLSIVMVCCCLALFFVPHVNARKDNTLREGFKIIYFDMKELIRSPIAVYSMAVVISPIGIGACFNVWSSVAAEWKVSANDVALFTGTIGGISQAMGCIFGGWASDKLGRWIAFFGAGMMMAMVTLAMSFLPQLPPSYKIGILLYDFAMGINFASFSAIVLHAIGKGLASTKYAVISSFGNIPVVGMTSLVGWLHDAKGVKMMLLGETFIGIGFILACVLAMYVLQSRKIMVKA